MKSITHLTVTQINRVLAQQVFKVQAPHRGQTRNEMRQDCELLWTQVYRLIGPEHTLDLMTDVPELERQCRLFCWACLTRFTVLLQLEHSKYCLGLLHQYAHEEIDKNTLKSAHKTCVRAGRQLDYDTEQVLRQANAALIWSLGVDEMFSPSEMLRRIALVEEIDQSATKFTQLCIEELEKLINRIDSEQAGYAV